MHKRGTIDLDNETVTAECLLNARGSFRQTSVLSRADSTMKLKTQTQDAKEKGALLPGHKKRFVDGLAN